MEDDGNPKFFGESMLLQPDRLSRIRWGLCCRISDMIQSKGFHSLVKKFDYFTWQPFVFGRSLHDSVFFLSIVGTHSNDGCTPIFLSVNVNVNNTSPLTQAVLELLAFSLAGHFERTLGHRHMFWVWPYGHGSQCPSYSGADQNPIMFAIFHARWILYTAS